MKTYNVVGLLILLLFITSLECNAKGVKFGKYSKEEIKLTECSYEKDAVAVILHKTCKIDISYSMIRYFYHVRIKVLKEEGLKYADVELPFFRRDGIENISGVKGQTVDFDADGKKQIAVLSSKSIFNVDTDENYGETRFGMPSVKVGSIIEYKYVLNSNFYTYLDTWYFQDDIPTLYSSLKVNMPETFRYNLVTFGDRLSSKYIKNVTNEWILTDMPSIRKEEFVNNHMDFVEQIRFQLSGYYTKDHAMHGTVKFVDSRLTWKNLSKEYLERVDILNRKGFAQKVLEDILDGGENDREKVIKVYDYIRKNVKWNELYRIYPKKSAPKILEEKVASNSEINLLLVLLLREAGLNCNPALSRTNNLGLLQKDYPLMSQFNQVLACVDLYGNKLFLNATSPYRPYNLLAEKDLNFYAFVLVKSNPTWQKVLPYGKSRQYLNLNYDFTNLNDPVCNLQIQQNGYYASESRQIICRTGVESNLRSIMNSSLFELSKDSTEVENELKVNKPLIVKSRIPIEVEWDNESNVIYFNPFPQLLKKNPFLKETRQYRIDYNYKRNMLVMISIKIPKSYRFEEIPTGQLVKLPDNIAKFGLTSNIINDELKLKIDFKINRASISKDLYADLRELYSLMVKHLNTNIIIKKDINISEK